MLFLPAISFAETYTFRFRPNGPACNHIEINDSDGKFVKVITLVEIRSPIATEDDLLISQIKEILFISSSTATTDLGMKTLLEATDFHDPRVKQRLSTLELIQ